MTMTSKIFKRVIPMVLAGTMMLVVAMPMSASAHDWDHHDHDNGHHYGWYKHDRDDFHGWGNRDRGDLHDWGWRHYDRDDEDDDAPRYYSNDYYPNNYYRGYRGDPCANLTHLRNVYRRDRRTGHPAAANDLVRQMRSAEARCGGAPYAGYGGYGYDQGALIGPLGNMFGLW
jgi:hypothetical protein